MSARTIAIPPATDIRVCVRPPYHLVVAAPPPLKADLDALIAKPSVIGMFTFDPGVTWPTREGCRWASTYLATGHAICLQFDNLADALSCRKRLIEGGCS